MTINQLRAFVALAGAGSVREAAKRLFVTQPAVSASVAALQAELGVRLVERDGRGLRLTDAGLVLAGYGRRILGLLEEAKLATVAGADPERGRLRLAAVTTAGEHIVPAVLATFRDDHPEVEVVLEVGNRNSVWDLLANGDVDLAIGGRPPQGGDVVSLAEAENELLMVSAPEATGRRSPRQVTVAELARRTWLVREPGSGTRSAAEELLEELGIAPLRLTLGSNGALRESAILGLGVALISRAAVARQLSDGTLEEWRVGPLPLQRPWHVVARGGWSLPATAGLFVQHLLKTGGFGPASAAL
jgi:LysR family transcriptional regulator, low CO2-responsive transcriptional regulator